MPTTTHSDYETECFFITPLGKEDSPERKRADGVMDAVVQPASEAAGMTPVRADRIAEGGHITLQVLEHCTSARLAVADLSGGNLNVYYEVGLRHALRLPVVLIADADETLPFDLLQQRTIFYTNDFGGAAACKHQVEIHLRKALDGHIDSPVQAALNLRALTSGDEMQQTLADLVTKVDELSSQTHAVARRNRVSPEAIRDLGRAFLTIESLAVDDSPDLMDVRERMQRAIRHIARATGQGELLHEFGIRTPIYRSRPPTERAQRGLKEVLTDEGQTAEKGSV
jgi:hypothetical protein